MQNIVGLDDSLAPDQRKAITQRNCVIYTFSGYEYTLISEWTRLFGRLRILDNLISGAVCYFLYDYFCILWNIHLTHARSCSCRHSLSWVVFYAVVRSWACICPHHWCRNPGNLKVLGRFRASVGQVLVPFVESIDRLDVVTCGVTRWLGRGCRAAWLGVGCAQWSACWSRGARGRRCRIGFVWRTVSRNLHVLETARTLGCAPWWAQDVGVYVHFVAGVSSVFGGSCLFDFWAPWL